MLGRQEGKRLHQGVRQQDPVPRQRGVDGPLFPGSGLWVLPCAALIVFSAMEWGCPAVLTASGTSISRRRCDKGMGLGTYSPYYDRELTLLRQARL